MSKKSWPNLWSKIRCNVFNYHWIEILFFSFFYRPGDLEIFDSKYISNVNKGIYGTLMIKFCFFGEGFAPQPASLMSLSLFIEHICVGKLVRLVIRIPIIISRIWIQFFWVIYQFVSVWPYFLVKIYFELELCVFLRLRQYQTNIFDWLIQWYYGVKTFSLNVTSHVSNWPPPLNWLGLKIYLFFVSNSPKKQSLD